MANLHVPDYLILPYGRAVKSDLQRIALSAVSADGLYFSTDVPVIYINKAKKTPMCLGHFERHFGELPTELSDADEQTILDHMCTVLKSSNPDMTPSEEKFLGYYFATLKSLAACSRVHDISAQLDGRKTLGLPTFIRSYKSQNDLWRALLPIPELQLYVQDPLAETKAYQPDNNFRVDYGFWNGQQLVAVEIDGAEPAGYARDIRRDRLLRRAGVDVIHIMNLEIARHKAGALWHLLPRQFFGFDWSYEGARPDIMPF